mgnify:CR=1 FL=1
MKHLIACLALIAAAPSFGAPAAPSSAGPASDHSPSAAVASRAGTATADQEAALQRPLRRVAAELDATLEERLLPEWRDGRAEGDFLAAMR